MPATAAHPPAQPTQQREQDARYSRLPRLSSSSERDGKFGHGFLEPIEQDREHNRVETAVEHLKQGEANPLAAAVDRGAQRELRLGSDSHHHAGKARALGQDGAIKPHDERQNRPDLVRLQREVRLGPAIANIGLDATPVRRLAALERRISLARLAPGALEAWAHGHVVADRVGHLKHHVHQEREGQIDIDAHSPGSKHRVEGKCNRTARACADGEHPDWGLGRLILFECQILVDVDERTGLGGSVLAGCHGHFERDTLNLHGLARHGSSCGLLLRHGGAGHLERLLELLQHCKLYDWPRMHQQVIKVSISELLSRLLPPRALFHRMAVGGELGGGAHLLLIIF
mmetsp:Transcript_32071/g.103486  ORF Transcript_32071/g.103486 Transcript_32071/m.103486 type:complete len:344 (-) Transcript_32071:88-1119(-)